MYSNGVSDAGLCISLLDGHGMEQSVTQYIQLIGLNGLVNTENIPGSGQPDDYSQLLYFAAVPVNDPSQLPQIWRVRMLSSLDPKYETNSTKCCFPKHQTRQDISLYATVQASVSPNTSRYNRNCQKQHSQRLIFLAMGEGKQDISQTCSSQLVGVSFGGEPWLVWLAGIQQVCPERVMKTKQKTKVILSIPRTNILHYGADEWYIPYFTTTSPALFPTSLKHPHRSLSPSKCTQRAPPLSKLAQTLHPTITLVDQPAKICSEPNTLHPGYCCHVSHLLLRNLGPAGGRTHWKWRPWTTVGSQQREEITIVRTHCRPGT